MPGAGHTGYPHVWYEVEIKELGYAPEPYVIADALMYADGQRIVSFKDMSMKMTGMLPERRHRIVLGREKDKGQGSMRPGRSGRSRKQHPV